VGTVTEIYDYLRLLYARAGTPRCPRHGERLEAQTVSQMVDQVLALPEGTALVLLAPVVRDRKGEHTNVMAELRAQGFIRARVDGEVCELDDPPTLDLHRKHTIEAVVDRFRVRPDLALRLAESFETALKLADGMATIAFMDEPKRTPLVFSDRFACPVCGYSIAELEPRLFSFNNPAGACATCDGLGVQQFFDAERVAAHPHLSLAGGAIRGWDRRNAYYFQLIRSLAEHYGFDVETPFEQLPEKIRKVVLFGSGKDSIEFAYFDGRGGMTRRAHRFEGIIPNMQRRYRETESGTVRDELSKYLGTHPCPACRGEGRGPRRRTVTVSIPAGLEDGDRLPVRGEGEAGRQGAPAGDLHVQVQVAAHPFLVRDGRTLHTRVTLPLATVLLGGSVRVPALEGGEHEVAVPAGVQPGQVLLVAHGGLPVRGGGRRGDLRLHVEVAIPRDLGPEERGLIERWAALRPVPEDADGALRADVSRP
jgi:excinuclease ABC A subunit